MKINLPTIVELVGSMHPRCHKTKWPWPYPFDGENLASSWGWLSYEMYRVRPLSSVSESHHDLFVWFVRFSFTHVQPSQFFRLDFLNNSHSRNPEERLIVGKVMGDSDQKKNHQQQYCRDSRDYPLGNNHISSTSCGTFKSDDVPNFPLGYVSYPGGVFKSILQPFCCWWKGG